MISVYRVGLQATGIQLSESKGQKVYGKVFKLENHWENGRVDGYKVLTKFVETTNKRLQTRGYMLAAL